MARTRLSPDYWMLARNALVVVSVQPKLDALGVVRCVELSAGDHCDGGGGDDDV